MVESSRSNHGIWNMPYAPGDNINGSTLVERHKEPGTRNAIWLIRCDCGQMFEKAERHIRRGKVHSCGCAARFKFGNGGAGNARHPRYNGWMRMIERCHDPKTQSFPRYGARGITVCDRWRWGDGQRSGFECFIEDMGPKPSPKHSIDRIDGNRGYEPENCRWADLVTQARNKASVPKYEYQGRSLAVTEWAEILGVRASTLRQRLTRLGWTIERTISQPVRDCGRAIT